MSVVLVWMEMMALLVLPPARARGSVGRCRLAEGSRLLLQGTMMMVMMVMMATREETSIECLSGVVRRG